MDQQLRPGAAPGFQDRARTAGQRRRVAPDAAVAAVAETVQRDAEHAAAAPVVVGQTGGDMRMVMLHLDQR